MLYRTPSIGTEERVALQWIEDLRAALRGHVAEPHRWSGSLRRLTFARAVQGSNSIEGYNASLDDVMAALDDEEPLDADTETTLALAGYRDAMTYVLQLARDRQVDINESLLKSLHFIMLKHDLRKNPGRWRPGAIFVRRETENEIVYEGPEAIEVPAIVAELVDDLADSEGPVLVTAAMAHLNLVLIHPFGDGNGRMARCLQSLVLARGQVLSPTFASIEEYLGRNTQAYYDVLAEVGRGSWHPENDARPWVRFCLTAHYRQANTLLRRIAETEALWDACAELADHRGVPQRAVGPLCDAARSLRIRRASYRAGVLAAEGNEISELTASRDLKALVDAGLLDPVGEKRGRLYVGTGTLREVWEKVRFPRRPGEEEDPFGRSTAPSTARSRRGPRGRARR